MQLPNVDSAIIEEEKIVGYLLNPSHPDGASKARFYESLRFSRADWELLAAAIRDVASNNPIANTIKTIHGCKYIIEGKITSPRGKTAMIRSVWIIDEGFDSPRLVTAFPCK